MQRYLLFDAGCTLCSGIADRVQELSAGWLEVRSLRDPEMHRLLESARAPRRWEPTLLILEDGKTVAHTGLPMRVHLVRGLGVRRAVMIARLIFSEVVKGIDHHAPDQGRRRMLKTAGLAIGGTVLGLPVLSTKVAALTSGASGGDPTTKVGIKEYAVSRNDGRLIVQFVHEKRPQSGVATISGISEPRTIIDLARRGHVMRLDVDRKSHKVSVTAGKSRAEWRFESNHWQGTTDGAQRMLDQYAEDIAIASALAAVLAPPPQPVESEAAASDAIEPGMATMASCPCSSQIIRAYTHGPHWWRSDACYEATNNLAFDCSNSYCWGCCWMYADCDCACLNGDFVCECSRGGKYCTGPCT